jgi:hypothetical protein
MVTRLGPLCKVKLLKNDVDKAEKAGVGGSTPSLAMLPALWLAPPPTPTAFLITPPPLNLHKCLPTGGFLQTAVSDAPHTPPESTCHSIRGASDTALAFLDRVKICFRLDDHSKARCSTLPDTSTAPVLENLREAVRVAIFVARLTLVDKIFPATPRRRAGLRARLP